MMNHPRHRPFHRRPLLVAASVILTALPAPAILDTNDNDMSDIWESRFNGESLFDAANPAHHPEADPDGDGRTNAAEWATGTNPFLAEAPDAFQLAATPSAVLGVHYLTMPTAAWKTYQFQTTADLATWQPLGAPYLGDGRPVRDIVQATLEGGGTPSRLFWRTVITDPDDDDDDLTNWEECEIGTDPNNPDSDGDGLGDKLELLTFHADGTHLDPLNRDTDGDGIWDGDDSWPFLNGNDPLEGGDPDGGNLAPAFSANLEGFWDFETHVGISPKTFPDRSGNNRPATGGFDGSIQNGMPSNCARIGPVTVTVPTAVLQTKPNHTIAGWFKFGAGTIAATTTRWQIIWSLYDQQGVGPHPQYAPLGQGTVLMARGVPAAGGNPAQEQWFIGKYQQTYHWNEYPAINGNPKTVCEGRYFTLPAGFTDDARWHHIAITRAASADLQNTYIDGALHDSGPIREGAVDYDANTRFIFGNIHPGNLATQLTEGYIDRLRVHSRALDAAEITALHRQDIDRDGLWDITEADTRFSAYATTGHPTQNPPPSPSLAGYQLSPYYVDDSSGDHDDDDIDNLTEQAGGTKPTEPDTDGDGLPDGFETTHGLNPNTPWIPASGGIPAHPDTTEATANPDSDGVDNLAEYLNNTDPNNPYSDGDPVNDGAEIAQGSNPNDAGDNGQPPAAAPENISFHINGDYTQWEATVTGKGPGDWRVRRFRMSAPGVATTQGLGLHPGNTYEYSLKYLSTRPDQNVPWYCWEASIAGQTAPAFTLNGTWLVDNSSALLAEHSHSQGVNNVKEKKPVTIGAASIVADTDRSGAVADADLPDKDQWTDARGAIYAVNWDNDNAAPAQNADTHPDAITWWSGPYEPNMTAKLENWHIENDADALDLAPVRISLPTLAPGTRVFLTLAETEDLHAVHIYRSREARQIAIWGGYSATGAPWKDGDSNPLDLEITSWLAPASGSGGIPAGNHTLGMEGLVLRGMPVPGGTLPGAPGMFSGIVEIGLQILLPGQTSRESCGTVKMKVAPFLLTHNERAAERVFVRSATIPAASPAAPLLPIAKQEIVSTGLPSGLDSHSQWMQDHVEIGHTQFPGGPPTTLTFVCPYDSQLAAWPVTRLLAPDHGVFAPGRTFNGAAGDFGGNIELSHPTPEHPLGRAVIGSLMSPELVAFFTAQEKQSPVFTDLNYTEVRHIDEVVSYGPGGKIYVADPAAGITLLRQKFDTPEKQLRAVFFSPDTQPPMVAKVWKTNFSKDNLVVVTDQDYDAVNDDWVRITANGGVLRLVGGSGGGQVAVISNIRKAVQTDASKLDGNPNPAGKLLIEVSHIYHTGSLAHRDWKAAVSHNADSWFNRPTEGGELVCVEKTLLWGASKPALITVREVLADANFVTFNETSVQQKIAETLATCGVTAPVRIPCLFYYIEATDEQIESANGRDAWYAPAFTPNPANLQWVDGVAFHPKTFGPRDATGTDVFEEAIQTAFAGANSTFIDAWTNYHIKGGEIHCGSAVERTPPPSWWNL